MKPYVGIRQDNGKREVFKADCIPTERTHGHLYAAAIGPFVTMRGARFMADYGAGNPHLYNVAITETIAREEAEREQKRPREYLNRSVKQ